jgi:tryptophan-rich sensory protein
MQKSHLFSLILFILAFQLIGGGIGMLTAQDVDVWYKTLERSPLTPPDYTFGIVWTILYVMLACSAWRVYVSPSSPRRQFVLTLFTTHMLVNWAWNPVFFMAHAILPAFLMILFLIFTAAMLAYLIWPIRKWAAMVFMPYLLWLTFAGHLTQFIWLNN